MRLGENPNIIMIVIDSLRKDYSNYLEKKLKKMKFISYQNVITPAPWTIPSHASIFTGYYPLFHGAHETKKKKSIHVRLKKIEDILSLQLSRLRYETYLLSANPFIRPLFGFVGFDYFYDATFTLLSGKEKTCIEKLKLNKNRLEIIKTLIFNNQYKLLVKVGLSHFIQKYIFDKIKNKFKDKGTERLIKNLKKALRNNSRDLAKFIFINLMDVHQPYFPGMCGSLSFSANFKFRLKKVILNDKCLTKVRKAYINEVKNVTERIIKIFDLLSKKNLFDNSLIIVTSDHGQLLGDHGRVNHGTFLDDELLRVPMLIKYPEKSQKIINKASNKKYISLTRLKHFIIDGIRNNCFNDALLYTDVCYAESYGLPIWVNVESEKEKRILNEFEKYRIAIYYEDFKGIFNVTDWKFESIESYKQVPINEKVKKKLKTKLINFLSLKIPQKIM
jgi:membrane-anchored protein YejM (alkaline phosphatase superfamily)